jgi:hypothetical protein
MFRVWGAVKAVLVRTSFRFRGREIATVIFSNFRIGFKVALYASRISVL